MIGFSVYESVISYFLSNIHLKSQKKT
jgi:hypothetical protein